MLHFLVLDVLAVVGSRGSVSRSAVAHHSSGTNNDNLVSRILSSERRYQGHSVAWFGLASGETNKY